MHSGGFELTELTYTRLEENLIRHRGDRLLFNRHCIGNRHVFNRHFRETPAVCDRLSEQVQTDKGEEGK